MKPIILQGHTRPIKAIQFNKDGDLIFTGSNDRYVTLWATESGERIGTFMHSASVNTIAITKDSKTLISGDSTGGCYLWEIHTGQLLKKIDMDPTLGVKSVDLSYGDKDICFSYSGRNKDSESAIDVYSISEILKAQSDSHKIVQNLRPGKSFKVDSSKYTSCRWMDLNKNILCAKEDGSLNIIDVSTGKTTVSNKIHDNIIMDLDISRREEIVITASKDGKSCIVDPETLEVIHTIAPTDPVRNLNSCKISPLFDVNDENEAKFHGIIGGGQDSREVTTTDAKKGGFEIMFYNLMYGNEMGSLQGHFGPVNTLAFGPSGKVIASGGEDATIRIHKLDEEYMNLN